MSQPRSSNLLQTHPSRPHLVEIPISTTPRLDLMPIVEDVIWKVEAESYSKFQFRRRVEKGRKNKQTLALEGDTIVRCVKPFLGFEVIIAGPDFHAYSVRKGF